MFNPFFNPYRVRRIDQGGIPTLFAHLYEARSLYSERAFVVYMC